MTACRIYTVWFHQKAGKFLHVETVNYGLKDAVDAKTHIATGDRIVAINGDTPCLHGLCCSGRISIAIVAGARNR